MVNIKFLLMVFNAALFAALQIAPDRVTKVIFAFLFMLVFLYLLAGGR